MKHLAILAGSNIKAYGGGEKYLIELVKRLKDFDITVYSSANRNIVRVNDEKIKKMLKAKLIYYNAITIPISKESSPLTLSGLSMLKQLCKYDAIYITNPSAPTIFMILLYVKLRKLKTKIVFGVHDPGFLRTVPQENTFIKRLLLKFYAPIYKAILFKVPNIHVLNNEDKKKLEIEGYKGKIYLIPNFLYYNKSEIKIYSNKNKFIILFGGRLAIYHKGIDLLVDIIKKVLDKNKNIEFHIFGSGEYGQELIKDLAKRYHENAKYLGFISNKNVENEYEKSSLYIMTSRIEAFPAVILEAQAHGLPIIAFDIKGPRDIISDFSGSIIKPFDTDAFANEILRYYNLWKEGELNAKYKKSIIGYIFSKYSDKVIIPKIEKMLIS